MLRFVINLTFAVKFITAHSLKGLIKYERNKPINAIPASDLQIGIPVQLYLNFYNYF